MRRTPSDNFPPKFKSHKIPQIHNKIFDPCLFFLHFKIFLNVFKRKFNKSLTTCNKMQKRAAQTCFQLALYLSVMITAVSTSPNRLVRSKNECNICGRKTSSKFFPVTNLGEDIKKCFGCEFKETGVLCASCIRALGRHRSSGNTYEHISELN